MRLKVKVHHPDIHKSSVVKHVQKAAGSVHKEMHHEVHSVTHLSTRGFSVHKLGHSLGGKISGAAHHAGGVASHGAHHAGGVAAHGAHHAGGVMSHGAHHAGGVAAHSGHHAGSVVSHGAKHAGAVTSHAAHHAGGVMSNGAHHAGGVMSHGSHHAGGVIAHGGQHAREQAAHELRRFTDQVLELRHLSASEKSLANTVFRGSVPLDRVLISPLSGMDNRPFCVPGSFIIASTGMLVSMFGALASPLVLAVLIGEIGEDLHNKYVIFYGKEGYKNRIDHPFDHGRRGQTLIHELTHVWQGEHSSVQWSYLLKSCCAQIKDGSSAYEPQRVYDSNHLPQFQDFGPEQQATIVERWYEAGSSEYQFACMSKPTIGYGIKNGHRMPHDFYRFIRSNIRPGNPNAVDTRTTPKGFTR